MVSPDSWQTYAYTVELPKTHHALEKPEEWNKEWETFISSKILSPALFLENEWQRYSLKSDGLALSIESYRQLLSSTLDMRQRLSVMPLVFEQTRFETKWLAASVATRREHALVGISEACAGARNLNDSRMLTGDILTLDHLSRDGKIVIDLWKSIIVPKGDPALTAPHNFPGTSWESFLKSEERRPADKLRESLFIEMKVLRTKLIYYVVWFTTWSFLGIPRPGVMVRKNHNTTRNRTDEEKERSKLEVEIRKMSFGNTKAKQLAREDVAAVLKRKSNRAEQCDHCLKVEMPDQEKFRRCARCWDKLQRSVHYCSRECQIAAYKPIHKAICGKVLDIETATAAAVSSVSPNIG